MFHHRLKPIRAPVKQIFVGGVNVMQQVFLDDTFVKRRARHRPVNQILPERRLELHQSVQFLRDDFRRLIIKPDNHRSQHRDAVLAEFGENLVHRPALLLGVTRPRAFVADPETVNAHLQDFFHLVLADGLDAGEREDRKPFAARQNAFAKFHRALFVEQKILVNNQKHQARIEIVIAFHHVVNVAPGRQQLDVLARKEMRRAAEIAAVRAA